MGPNGPFKEANMSAREYLNVQKELLVALQANGKVTSPMLFWASHMAYWVDAVKNSSIAQLSNNVEHLILVKNEYDKLAEML